MFSGVIDFSGVIYSFAIGSVGAIMFVLVDKYEPEGPMARILKLDGSINEVFSAGQRSADTSY